MAEAEHEEAQGNVATNPSTPDSTTGDPSGLKARKDRNCPFCGQAFTSSSLGRHLDLYIRPKHPKPPDGVHNVEEIRKIRGSITRRQPRTNVKSTEQSEDGHKRDYKRGSNGWTTVQGDVHAADSSPADAPIDAKDATLRTWFNAANWQATGVINNLPPRAPSRTAVRTPLSSAPRVQDVGADGAGDQLFRSDYASEDIEKLQSAAEVGRAAEMALREVMGSLEAAKKKIEPEKLYDDFDFCSLSFPGLCLAMLPPPPTLFSTTPFPVAHTWALSPPGEAQKAALARALHQRISALRAADPDSLSDSFAFKKRIHLDGAWEHWQKLSEAEQATAWSLEICRAFAKEREATTRLKEEVEVAHQRIRHLEADYDRLSRCQLPRDYLLHPVNTIPVSSAVLEELKSMELKSGAAEVNYDANALLDKWKAAVKKTARPPRPPTQPHHVESVRSRLKADILLNGSVIGVNGPMPRNAEESTREDYAHRVEPETQPSAPQSSGRTQVEEIDTDGGAARSTETSGSPYNSALVKLRGSSNSPYKSPSDGSVNANGKRPFGPSPMSGREGGPKVFRERAV